MKQFTIFALAFIMFLGWNSNAKAQTKTKSEKQIIMFEGSMAEAIALAKKKNKLIFVDAYATWCGPCKMLKSQTFKNAEVADYYNENFINMAVDMEKGEGPDLAKKYGVRAYPTLLFINSSGEVVHTGMGFQPAEKFIAMGKEVQAKSGGKPAKTKKAKKTKKTKA